MRVFIGGVLVAALAAGACGGQRRGRLTHRPNDIFGQRAATAAEAPCAPSPIAGPVPTAPGKRPDNAFGHDVVFYLAHPEDETLFTPGTMAELVAAKGRIFEVVLSHGEGGRLLERDATG